jgi:hypothetical protein
MTIPDKRLIFITSLGRTGTLFLGENASRMIGDSISYHEVDVLVPSEAHNWRRKLRGQNLLRMTVGKLLPRHSLATLGVARVAKRVSDDEAVEVIRRLRGRFFAQQRAGIVLEANTQYADLADLLPRAFPNSRTVFVVRDPRGWVRSLMNRRDSVYTARDPRSWFPHTRIRPHHTGERALAERWRRMPLFEKLAWSWAARHRHVLPRLEGEPRSRVLRYEDLFESEEKAVRFREMLEFITAFPDGFTAPFTFDPAILGERSHSSRHGAFPHWREWSPELARRLDELCGEVMRPFGYGTEPAWAEKLRQAGI